VRPAPPHGIQSSGFVVSQSLSPSCLPACAGSGVKLLAAFFGTCGRASRALALMFAALVGSAAAAEAEDRTLKLFFTHTGERAEITYKRDGRLDQRGLIQLNRFLRDWRKNETTRMDPRLFDLLWEIYDRSGAQGPIHIVSGYRSPSTNSMLRGRSRASGVATKSQHMLGRAIDFYIPGVKLSTLRGHALQLQAGGVGYYPTFVHVDVGNVRAWPRVSRQELARLFPDGRTVHMPADGRPLAGYSQAIAQLKRRGAPARSIEIAASTTDDEDEVPVPSRRITTAMLPTPRSRAEEALALQVVQKAAPSPTRAPEFADLASLAIPAPASRPGAVETPAALLTASLQPRPDAALRSSARAFAPVAGSAAQSFGLLKQPATSIASLPLSAPEMEPEDDFDGQEALVAWAVSPPGSRTGLTAPVLVDRVLADHSTPLAPPQDALPSAISDGFDGGRFWSDG